MARVSKRVVRCEALVARPLRRSTEGTDFEIGEVSVRLDETGLDALAGQQAEAGVRWAKDETPWATHIVYRQRPPNGQAESEKGKISEVSCPTASRRRSSEPAFSICAVARSRF